jgi:hypothetical protein
MGGGIVVTDSQQAGEVDQANTGPRPAEVSFVTTEHFALQSARSSTIIESTGRANVFLGSVTGGLVALGLMATATGVGTAFYAFGLVILPALAFVGLVTFARVLQSSIEDHGYARRISRLRGYYFEHAPELTRYLLSVPSAERLAVQGRRHGHWHWQGLLAVATMVAMITAVLAGSAAGLLAAATLGHSLVAALAIGVLVAVVALFGMMRYQRSTLKPAITGALFAADEDAEPQ